MVSNLKSFIVSTMSGNDVLYVLPSKKMKAAIGSDKEMKYDKIYDAETLSRNVAAATKLMKRMADMSLNRSRGKSGNMLGHDVLPTPVIALDHFLMKGLQRSNPIYL